MFGNQMQPMQQYQMGQMQPMQPMQPMQQMRGMATPYIDRLNGMMQAQAPQYDIIHVNGEGGARAFRMAPNSRCLLLDETAPIVWLAQTDGAGFPTVTPYTISPYQMQPQPDPMTDLAAKVQRLEATVYGKPDSANPEQSASQQPAGGPVAGE